jgi:hypothetical protein
MRRAEPQKHFDGEGFPATVERNFPAIPPRPNRLLRFGFRISVGAPSAIRLFTFWRTKKIQPRNEQAIGTTMDVSIRMIQQADEPRLNLGA